MRCKRRLDGGASARHLKRVSVRIALRNATAGRHETVDAAFAAFDLSDAISYGRFLTAHARALPAVERALAANDALPPFTTRTRFLERDLAALGIAMPAPLPLAAPGSDAAAFGALYVIEGSRLGGAMLSRSIPPSLPRTYLSAAHSPGGWRALGEELDRAGAAGGDIWLAEAVAAAEATFDLYVTAAASV